MSGRVSQFCKPWVRVPATPLTTSQGDNVDGSLATNSLSYGRDTNLRHDVCLWKNHARQGLGKECPARDVVQHAVTGSQDANDLVDLGMFRSFGRKL